MRSEVMSKLHDAASWMRRPRPPSPPTKRTKAKAPSSGRAASSDVVPPARERKGDPRTGTRDDVRYSVARHIRRHSGRPATKDGQIVRRDKSSVTVAETNRSALIDACHDVVQLAVSVEIPGRDRLRVITGGGINPRDKVPGPLAWKDSHRRLVWTAVMRYRNVERPVCVKISERDV